MDAGYYPRHVGETEPLLSKDRRKLRKGKPVGTLLGREGTEKTIPDIEAQGRKILGLGRELDQAAQIILAKDNELLKYNKEKEKLQQVYNRVNQRMRQIGDTVWRDGV